MKEDKQKPWGFCVTKDSTCTMNYCDENGCQDRIRVPVEPIEPMSNESETIEQVFERCTSTDFSSRDREEIFRAMQEYSDLQVKDYKIAQEGNLRRLDELNEWKRSSIEVHKPLYDYMQGPGGTALGLRIGDSIIKKTVELLKEIELGKENDLQYVIKQTILDFIHDEQRICPDDEAYKALENLYDFVESLGKKLK